jgi:hypothetical protein
MLTRFCVSDINVRDSLAIVKSYFLGVFPILWVSAFFVGYVRCPHETGMKPDYVPMKIKKTIDLFPYFIWWNVVSLVRTFSDGLSIAKTLSTLSTMPTTT